MGFGMARDHESVRLVPDVTVDHVAMAVLLAALAAVLAQLSIQLPGGIPFSFQPFAVFFAGLLLGPIWGGFALLVYFAVGLAGVPVFSNLGAGLGYVLGPTGGFLVGFVLAAIAIGAVTHRAVEPRPFAAISPLAVTLGLLLGIVLVYAVGIPWFASVQGMSLAAGADFLALFFVGDLIKAALTVGLFWGGSDHIDQLR